MREHVCPWWGGYFIDNRLRRVLHKPERILASYLQPGMTVLDFGCGMGFFSIPMAEMVEPTGTVIAVDLQPQMLRSLGKRAAKVGVTNAIRPHQCEKETLALQEPVDFVLAFWSLHEVPNARKILTEISSCLVANGKMLLVEPRGHVSAAAFQQMVATAQEVGLRLDDEPKIRLSRAALSVRT
jgi:ubiquinone/menaquinone biosynthesis C-methylase UbiE